MEYNDLYIFRVMCNHKDMITRFIIYGLLGWNVEIFWTGFCSVLRGDMNLMGHTSIWMFFIYGSAVFVFEPVHRAISEYNRFVRGCVWSVLIFAIEFISGMILRLLGIEAWYYSGDYAVYGVIRLDYLPLWFAVGLIFERIHTLLLKYHIGIK